MKNINNISLDELSPELVVARKPKFSSAKLINHGLRTLTQYELVYITHKPSHHIINGIDYLASPGDIIFRKPKETNHNYSYGTNIFVVFNLTPKNTNQFNSYLNQIKSHIKPRNTDHYRRLFEKLLAQNRIPKQDFKLLKQKATLLEILIALLDENEPVNLDSPISLDQSINYIHDHYNENITLDDLAKKANLSKSYYHRLFKEFYQKSPREYLLTYRLEKAVDFLLYDNISIQEIAIRTGFDSCSYFIKCFKRKFQITPSNFRKNYSKENL